MFETAGVILIRFPSDCRSGLGDAALELAALPALDCVRESAGVEGDWGRLDDSTPSGLDDGDGFPSFAKRLLRIYSS